MDIEKIRAALANTPGVEPGAPAPADHVAAFEARFAITLPAAFRGFVLEVADGLVYEGDPWLFSLDQIGHDLADDALAARPFPYDDAEAEAIRVAVRTAVDAGNVFSPEVMALQRGGDPDGCLTLASNGGNDFSVLVVTGEQAGWMWRTGEIDFPESPKLYSPGSADMSPLGFEAWLAQWGDCFLGLMIGS